MNVYIDLGSHVGKTIRRFMASSQYDTTFQIHAFEASPLIHRNYPVGVIYHYCAAWIYDGLVNLYICRKKKNSQAASVFRNKTSGHLDKNHPIVVRCIDFSKWIKDNFSQTDNIVVKSDIEGAEYQVFNKMIADKTICYIKKIYMDERHWDRIGVSKLDDRLFINNLKSYVEVHNDYKF